MLEKYFVDALYKMLSTKDYAENMEREHPLIDDHLQDRRKAQRIDIITYLNCKPTAFEVKSDEGNVWDGIEQAIRNKERGFNSYLVTGKKPNLEQMLAMCENKIGCHYMPAPSAEAELFPIVGLDDKVEDVMARYYAIWKAEQLNKEKYGG